MKPTTIIAVCLALLLVGVAYAVQVRPLRQSVTLTGAGAVTLGQRPYVEITCTNAGGCPVTVATYSPASASTQIYTDVIVVCLNAQLAGATCSFANQAGILVLASATTLDHLDVLRLGYTGGVWISEGTANNVPPTPTPTP